jgi:Zn-dependent protease
MTAQSVSLGKIFKIPVRVDYSWFLIFVLFTWLLATSYYPVQDPSWPLWEYWVMGAVTSLMLFVSVLLHELGHSVVANRNGIPVRSITLFIFGGVSQIEQEPTRPSVDFLVASAGLSVSLLLGVFFTLTQPLLAGIQPFSALFLYLAYINFALLAFNVIPGFPLDGGRVFRAIVWGATRNYERATVIAATVGRVIAFLFILLGVWLVFFGSFINGLWIIFIGWFLESASASEVREQTLRRVLAGRKVSQIMGRNYVTVPADLTLQRLADDHILGTGRRFFFVEKNGVIAGIATLHCVRQVPREQWPSTPASQAMIPMEDVKCVGPNDELWDALQEMNRDGFNQLPVIEDGQVRGILSRENVIDYLRTLQAMHSR